MGMFESALNYGQMLHEASSRKAKSIISLNSLYLAFFLTDTDPTYSKLSNKLYKSKVTSTVKFLTQVAQQKPQKQAAHYLHTMAAGALSAVNV